MTQYLDTVLRPDPSVREPLVRSAEQHLRTRLDQRAVAVDAAVTSCAQVQQLLAPAVRESA